MPLREIITTGSQLAWLAVSILLLVHLRIFDRRTLLSAPVRRSNLTMLSVAAVFLLYIGVVVATQAGLMVFRVGQIGPPATTAPFTARPGDTRPSTAPATEPTTEPASLENTHVEMIGQLADAFTKAIPVILILFLCRQLVVGGIGAWGLSLRKLVDGVRFGLLGFLIIYPILILFNLVVTLIFHAFDRGHKDEIHPTLTLISQHGTPLGEQLVFVLVAGLFAPVLEEIFFRGLIQSVLMERGWGFTPRENMDEGAAFRPTLRHRWAAILVSSFIFAGIHLMPESFVVLFVLALALGYLYERTGNLWACIVLHAAFNCLNMYLFTRS